MTLAFPKAGKPWRSASHLQHVRSLACCGCGSPAPSEAHHVGSHAMSVKPSDALACPLCYECHRGPHGWHVTARIAGLPTREASMACQWMGVIHALGGARIADNLDPEAIARRLAAERERR